jgi:hypothetical protein
MLRVGLACRESLPTFPMSKPFDATLKDLIRNHAADWLTFLGLTPGGPVEMLPDTDLSAVTAAADKFLRVGSDPPWLLHLELESSPRSRPAGRLQWYNTLARYHYDLPVWTVVVLLRREANATELTGLYQHQLPGQAPYLEFRYQVVRLWEVPVERFLHGGPGLLPLAPLADVPEAHLPQVVQQMGQSIASLSQEQAEWLWSVAYIITADDFGRTIQRFLRDQEDR